jgi:signal transduction histidine kinase
VRCEGNAGLLQVDDSGEGIPLEHLARVFDRFHRVDPSRARSTGGTGLGLAIARSLVVAHNGRINISNRPGGGTRVSIYLPLAESDPDALEAGRPTESDASHATTRLESCSPTGKACSEARRS